MVVRCRGYVRGGLLGAAQLVDLGIGTCNLLTDGDLFLDDLQIEADCERLGPASDIHGCSCRRDHVSLVDSKLLDHTSIRTYYIAGWTKSL